jgi:hypothetical protein
MIHYKNVNEGFAAAINGTIILKSAQIKWKDK